MSGFVYVLSHHLMPAVVKIGKTERHPELRAKELWSTGLPTPFTIEASIWCQRPGDVEREIHEALDSCRVNKSREFFFISVSDAILTTTRLALNSQSTRCCDVRYQSECLDAIDILRYTTLCGRPRSDIGALVNEIADSAWIAASEKLTQRRLRERRHHAE